MAKFYTYRNLNRGLSFSVKHRGIVVDRPNEAVVIEDGTFSVSQAGRERCLRQKKRNVHAFVVSEAMPVRVPESQIEQHKLEEVKYNPYVSNCFINKITNQSVHFADRIYLIGGRCFVEHK